MQQAQTYLPLSSLHKTGEAELFVTAEAAALAILRLQVRIGELERENEQLRRCSFSETANAGTSVTTPEPPERLRIN